MFVLKNEGKRREKIRYMGCRSRARPCHYRHRPCQGSGFLGFGMASQARAVPSFWHFRLKFFFSVFLNLAQTITYKTT